VAAELNLASFPVTKYFSTTEVQSLADKLRVCKTVNGISNYESINKPENL